MATSDAPDGVPTWPAVRSFAAHAEAVGLDSVWVFDHFLYEPPTGEPTEGMLEAWTIVSALAATTASVEIGQLVMCASFRNPGLLAKMAATADAVSGGRLVLGLGAGWHEPEYRAFGYPFDHRVDRFEEVLRIAGPLLRGESVTIDGRYHRVRDARLLPPPERDVPVLVAGKGPRMLRLTARHADAWNTAWFGEPDDELRARIAVLDQALEAEHRDPATLRRTVGVEVGDGTVLKEPDDVARALDAYEGLGFDDVIVLPQPMTERSLDRLAEAVALRSR